MHRAYGIISPANTINITEINIAKAGGTTLSKNIGRASIQNALATSNVHNNKWCLYNRGNIIYAFFYHKIRI